MALRAATGDNAFERVCDARDVALGTLRAVKLSDGTPVCIGNRDGALFAIIDLCPHQKFALSDGELMPDGSLVCARHGAAYATTTGACTRGPKGESPCGRLRMCELTINNGAVYVRAPQLSF